MIAVKIPKLGLTMENATVAKWAVRSGDRVKKDDIVLVIETDKVTYEVTAPESGIFHPIVQEGSLCAVEQDVAYIASDMEEYKKIASQYPAGGPMEAAAKKGPEVTQWQGPEKGVAARIKASPLARAMAREHGIDLSVIKGTGPGGRVVRADILTALEKGPERSANGPAARDAGVVKATVGKTVLERIPIRGARKVIFDHMFMSISASAQLTIHTEACAEAIVRLRDRLGTRPSYNAILIKAAASVLRRHPRLNASVSGSELVIWREINIGLAMESGDFLVVPVVRDAPGKSISQIDAEIAGLAEKARSGTLAPDDMAEGTFTITNLGLVEIDLFTPIIRPPESAILGVGRIVKRPWVEGEGVVAQLRMGLSLTFDHRIIDGAPAARFLKELKEVIEEPLLMLG